MLPCQRISTKVPPGRRPGWFPTEREALRLANSPATPGWPNWWQCYCGVWNPTESAWCEHEIAYGTMGDQD